MVKLLCLPIAFLELCREPFKRQKKKLNKKITPLHWMSHGFRSEEKRICSSSEIFPSPLDVGEILNPQNLCKFTTHKNPILFPFHSFLPAFLIIWAQTFFNTAFSSVRINNELCTLVDECFLPWASVDVILGVGRQQQSKRFLHSMQKPCPMKRFLVMMKSFYVASILSTNSS